MISPNEILCNIRLSLKFVLSNIDNDIVVPQMAKILNSQFPTVCLDVDIVSDNLIEETEVVMLSLELTDSHGITGVAPNTTNIIIMDEDCEQ